MGSQLMWSLAGDPRVAPAAFPRQVPKGGGATREVSQNPKQWKYEEESKFELA